MPTFQEKLAAKVAAALDKIKHARLHPEEFDRINGRRLYTSSAQKRDGGEPLAPRDRISVRLELAVAVKRWEHALLQAIMDDTEALADAKVVTVNGLGPEQVGELGAKMYVEGWRRAEARAEEKK